MARTPARAELAERVWRAMFDFLMQSAPHRTRSLSRRGLTPNDSRALFSLEVDEGRSMRSLADEWQCDPSNATWIVDRLEKLGLAERRGLPNDRRVKMVALTAKGQKTRADVMKEFNQPPPELAALDDEDLQTLDRVLVKLAPGPGAQNQPAAARGTRAPRRIPRSARNT